MKVAVDILPGLGTGVGRWQRETVRVLGDATGSNVSGVTAFSFGKRYPRPEWIPRGVGYRVSRLPGRIQWALSGGFGLPVEWVCGLGHPDVILELNLHPLRARRPVVLAVADVSWRSFAGQYRTTFSPPQIRRAEQAIQQADHILTISVCSADALVRGGVPADRITVAPLGVGEEFRIVSPADADRVRLRYGLPREYILYVGGINERKNLGVLVAAVDQRRGMVPLVLAGPKPAEPLAFWGLDRPWVRHLGYIPDADVPGLYAAATVKVFPSKLEGYGLPLVEAMAAGVPVLAADTPIFREVGGAAACFFPADDATALAALLRMALESETFRQEYRERGREWAQSRTWAAYGDRLLNALRAATRPSGAP